ncbi:MAG TPA: hypothetical protein VF759_02575 [Allosphingosinicella sp.]|jgi:hypothetical protein
MQTIYTGIVARGFQFASGAAVGRTENGSPFPAGTLQMQREHFKAAGVDFDRLVPGLKMATINLRLDVELELARPDRTVPLVDWTVDVEDPRARIPPETFSFVRCCFVYPAPDWPGRFAYYPGLLYYPHPETKPATNAHDYGVLEVLAQEVPNLRYDTLASVICRADAFAVRKAPF